ncbi:MAG: hypothetical protein II620_06795, partial [Paludibacteraceae bacterium]|nr:hypothetical protein [Paludibacteraceae bacterium]
KANKSSNLIGGIIMMRLLGKKTNLEKEIGRTTKRPPHSSFTAPKTNWLDTTRLIFLAEVCTAQTLLRNSSARTDGAIK